jgi:tetratricopeptide (TPR) repeat protein
VVELNTASVNFGVSLNPSDIFIEQGYSESNLRGLAQALEINYKIGLGKNNEIQGSLTSPGSQNGLPMQGTVFENDLNFRDHAYRASDLGNPFLFSQSLESLDVLIDITRRANQGALMILLLNNSGKARQIYATPFLPSNLDLDVGSNNTSESSGVYSEINFIATATTAIESDRLAKSAIDYYTEAQTILQFSDSPILEAIISLNKAQTYRVIGELDVSLQDHFHALNALREISPDMSLEQLLGEDVYGFLQEEWLLDQFWNEDSSIYTSILDFHEYLNTAIPMAELFMLFDVISIYSESGDYQSAIYASRAPRIKDLSGNSIVRLSELLTHVTRTELLSEDQSADTELFESLFSVWEGGSQATLGLLPSIYPLRSLELVFSDLNDPERSDSYAQEIKNVSLQQQRQTNAFLYYLLDVILENPEIRAKIREIDSQALIQIIDEIIQALPSLFDSSTGSWDRNEFQSLANRLVDPMISLVADSFDDIEAYRGWLNSLPPLIIEYLFADTDEISSTQAEERDIRFYQILLEDWPSEHESTDVLEGVKGFVLKLKADSHYRLGDYELAVKDYTEALRLFEKEEKLDINQNDTPGQVNQFS